MTAQKKIGAPKKAPKDRTGEISPARKAAFHILLAVERGHSHSDDLLRGKAVSSLSESDRNLTTALVLGVLRWQILLDHQVQPLLARPNAKLDSEILIALRLGAFQILRMDRIPARAAINESVELAKQAGHRFASAMVNAVLRKLAKPPQGATEDPVLKGHDFSRAEDAPKTKRALADEGSLSADLEAHPVWMVERWTKFFGLEAAEAICRHGQSEPALTVRIIGPDAYEPPPVEDRGFPPIQQKEAEWMGHPSVRDELAKSGIVLEPGELLVGASTVLSGDITATEAFREGRVRFQDEGSQLVAELASGNRRQKVNSILDACAAPGGKTLILAERNPQARIVACESSAPRMEQLRKRLAHLGERSECRLADATTLSDNAAYDLVLADVPCSGTGTLGRNPEIRHRLRPDDLARQAERQRAILSAALRAVRPGGSVVYSTCSLEPEENEQVVAAVLAIAPNSRQLSLEARIGELLADGILTASGAEGLLRSLTPEGALRLLPGGFHTDGFFIALVERTN
ncbi:MAG: transcription antitermination factor NusB [Terracidiphilus sp.]|jgi:16S rRNA (cytosine967-C5)-methyltransferase